MEKTEKLYYSGHADRDRNKPVVTFSLHTAYIVLREIYIFKYRYEKLRKIWVFNLKKLPKEKQTKSKENRIKNWFIKNKNQW